MRHRSTNVARFALNGVALAAACLWGTQAWALGLGRLTVQSALGETLRAEIEVTSLSAEEAGSLQLRVASAEAYRAAGVEYNPVLPSAVVQVVRRPDGSARDTKAAANRVINELFGRLNKEGRDVTSSPVSPAQLGAMLDLIADDTISGKIAKDLFEIVWSEGGDPRVIVEQRGMKQVTDLGAIETVIDDIIAKNPDKVEDAKSNPKAIGWFVGQAMKASGGKANP
ncbi:MAG: hypothetical protein IH627_09820, partial [Rubrivivax sp.]|nr:hypothetical protein [Rubrivivax sp.]